MTDKENKQQVVDDMTDAAILSFTMNEKQNELVERAKQMVLTIERYYSNDVVGAWVNDAYINLKAALQAGNDSKTELLDQATQAVKDAWRMADKANLSEAETERAIAEAVIGIVDVKNMYNYTSCDLDTQNQPNVSDKEVCLSNIDTKEELSISEKLGLDYCPKCGSGDVNFCGISVRPYCNECGHWGRVNYGTQQDAIDNWNEASAKSQQPDPRDEQIRVLRYGLSEIKKWSPLESTQKYVDKILAQADKIAKEGV